MHYTSEDTVAYWRRASLALRWQVNIGWVLDRMALPWVIGTLIASVGVLCVRYFYPSFSSNMGLAVMGGVFLFSIFIGLLRAQGRLETEQSSLVRLESHLGLNSALSSAAQGVCAWPPVPESASRPLRWNWKYLLIPIAGVALLSLAAVYLPLAERKQKPTIAAPREWQALMEKLNELEEEELIEQDYVEEMQKKLEQLQAQDPEDWYKHSSLEACDTLAKEHGQQARQLGEVASEAQQALDIISKSGEQGLTEEQAQKLQEQLREAAKQMSENGLKPNEEMREMLQQLGENVGGQQPPQMSAEEMQEIQDALDSLNEIAEGQSGEGGKDGQPGQSPGNNKRKDPKEINGVPEEDGYWETNRELGEEADKYKAQAEGALRSQDLSRSVPGELIEISQGEHEVDTTSTATQAGGATDHAGRGGSTTHQSNYLPEEKRALKNFFK